MRTHWTDIFLPTKPPRTPNPYRRFTETPTAAETATIKKIVREEIRTLDERVRALELEINVEAPTK